MKNRELVKTVVVSDEEALMKEQVLSMTLEYYLIETREEGAPKSRYGVEVVRRVVERDRSIHHAVIGGSDLCWDREKMLEIIRRLKGSTHFGRLLCE